MNAGMWLAVMSVALGTLAMRALPLVWMRRRLRRFGDEPGLDAMPPWLGVLGPLMIAALLGVSLAPQRQDLVGWLATLVGVAATLIVWRRTRALGWPVVAGVIAFGLVVIVARLWG
ncbi:Branched-chain amino acid transport protein (AzlD) [Modicisalibacter muralis]|uniref:Branched-chain amino acid transport protein (AzlD) n=1 Tax=Modicisalibacter muralis TaxID=119000 RepID=A0A1G9IQ37_9GAMM|nr:AzlD domain-containing protein [Halomonas muralis]SDL27389.1 Branched-chain amino acid transport protein (AzlD) [Halomonas muralis]